MNAENRIALTRGEQLYPLAEHARQHWDAHLSSGHDSAITKLMTSQYTDFYECDTKDCQTVERDISYASSMMLQIAPLSVTAEPIALQALIAPNLEETFVSQATFDNPNYSGKQDRARACKNPKHPRSAGECTRRVRRITKAAPIFAIEINRRVTVERLSKEISDKGIVHLAEENIHMQRISDYEQMDMSDWSTNGPATRIHSEGLTGGNLQAKYKIHGIVAYSHRRKHFTVFVKNQDRWLYFDDLAPAPVYQDPTTDWPDNFVEHMLVFKVAEHAEEDTILQSVETLPQTRARRGESTVSVDDEATSSATIERGTGRHAQAAGEVSRFSVMTTAETTPGAEVDVEKLKEYTQRVLKTLPLNQCFDYGRYVQDIIMERALDIEEASTTVTKQKNDLIRENNDLVDASENLLKINNDQAARLAFYEKNAPPPSHASRSRPHTPLVPLGEENEGQGEDEDVNMESPPKPQQAEPSTIENPTDSDDTDRPMFPIFQQPPPSPSKRTLRSNARQLLSLTRKKSTDLLKRGVTKSNETIRGSRVSGQSKESSPQSSPKKSNKKRPLSKTAATEDPKRSRKDTDDDGASGLRRFFPG